MLPTLKLKPGRFAGIATTLLMMLVASAPARAADQVYFSSTTNVTDLLVQKINNETVRVDMSCWYLTEHSISVALLNKFQSGVPVRLIGDRGSIFEIDVPTRNEFYWLASQGVPIRLRFNPTWYPEIDHWKTTIFKGQHLVSFGSGNYTPFELAPWSSTNYKDEVFLFTDDPAIVGAVETKFDQIWNDTLAEPESLVPSAPYLKDWNDACATEPTGNCSDYATKYPNPTPMIINTARLEPDNPLPPEIVWGQGPSFNNRLVQEINNETTAIDLVSYRLTVDNITNALLAKFSSGVPVRIIMEPNEYLNRKWPEFWLTHANMDKLWAAGVPIRQRIHDGLTHMKVLITSNVGTIASSNFAAAWQRDIDYFVPAATKPVVYNALKNEFSTMWNDTTNFATFTPQPPDSPTIATPANGATGIATTTPLVWNIAAFAVSYDVYLGTSSSNLTLVGNIPAQLVNNPPATYSFTPSAPLQPGTRYYWRIVSRTNATPVNPSLVGPSDLSSFTTAGNAGPPPAAVNPSPSNGAIAVGLTPTLAWDPGPIGTTYNVAFGTASPPPQVAANLSSPSFAAGSLSPNTVYYWQVTMVSPGGSTPGTIWSFTTGNGGTITPTDAVIYASDVTSVHGTWSVTADVTAAGGQKLTNPDNGVGALAAPLANPTNYVEATFNAQAGVKYRLWLRIHAIDDSKFNDSVFVQFSDAVDQSSNPVYRIGTTAGLTVNLWTCSTCQSFGWGWQRNAYWLSDSGDVWFPNSGAHTIRVQIREDGTDIDQIVLSPSTYATNPPGPVSNDNTIVPKPASPQPPSAPGSPSPANGATGVPANPTLTWTATSATSYDVSFGTTNPPPLAVSGTSNTSYTPPGLTNGTTYYWQILARNASGTTPSPVWSFATSVAPPSTPSSPSPANTATSVSSTATLTWTSAGATSYDVLFGTSDPPSQVASGLTTSSYNPGALAPNTTYFWQIVAHNSAGVNQGPEWTFTTGNAPPPPAPTSPAPANAATNVTLTPTLTWSAPGSTTYDVAFGTTNPPSTVASGLATASYAPGTLAASTTYYWQIVARNASGSAAGSVWSFTTGAAPAQNPEIVLYAGDIAPAGLHGAWQIASDASAAGGSKLWTPDAGVANTSAPLASPADYVDVTFNADAGVSYTVWFRINALNNSKFNDSFYVQFSDARVNGSAAYPIGSTSALAVNLATDANATSLNGWGWQNTSYWMTFQPVTVTFPATGAHTMRIQTREDGAQIDQIILSSAHYLTTPPGGPTNDATIVPKPAVPQPPAAPSAPAPANGATGVATNATLAWTSSNATSYDVAFGTANPPPVVASGVTSPGYAPGTLAASTTYYWQVIARNTSGSTSGPVWSFATGVSGPGTPSGPSPANGGTGVGTSAALSWSASGATSYDVNFGTTNPPAPAATNLATPSYAPPGLAYATQYFWQIVARNGGGTTTGPVWSFTTTAAPQPPSTPGSPLPADAASRVTTTASLTWSASGATSYDVKFGSTNPPSLAASGLTSASYTPSGMTAGTTYYWQVIATNANGSTAGPVWSFTTAPPVVNNVVIYASDIPGSALHGSWTTAADATSPNGVKLVTPDTGFASTTSALASPADYVDVAFAADANKPYTLWIRMQALNNNKFNDSLWVQFSDAQANGASIYPLNTTSALDVNLATDSTGTSLNGWGWQNGAYWITQATTVSFSSSGTHTMRIQVREDGVQLDQIVLSSDTYLSTAPGPKGGDTTIVPKP